MAYNNVPLANQRISDTQPLIQSNFQQIQTAISVNHVPIADLSGDQGKHKFITFVGQAPVPVFAGTDEGIYSVNSIAGPNPTINGPELFLKKFYDSGTLNFDVPFTASFISNTPIGSIINDMSGWTYLPSGLILKWGLDTASNPGRVVTFPTGAGIPIFTNCFTVIITPQPINAFPTISSTTITATNFTCSNGAAGLQIRYIAIGW